MNTNFHDHRHTPDTLVVIDTYNWYESHRREDEKIDTLNEAMMLTNMANTHGLRVDFETIANEKDRERINSYKSMRHNLHVMNGSRPKELIEVIMDLVDRINYEQPEKVIVVGDDEAFQLLCSAAEQNHSHVQIWTSNPKLPPKLRRYEIHPLEIVQAPVRKIVPTVVVRLDVENHLITLHKRGYKSDTHTYLEAVRSAITGLGNTINIQAWADWKRLRQSLGRDYQHEFEENGVKTFYQINEPGKSTSDVAMAGSIHESLDHENGLDIYVIGTGDADFTPVVESIHNQGKKVVVLALDGSLSNKLRQAADEVRLLDTYLPEKLPLPAEVANSSETNKSLVAALVVARLLRTHHWQYVYRDRLPSWLPPEWVRDAVENGLLTQRSPSETNCLILNLENPLTNQAVYFEKWVQQRIRYYLEIRKFDWLDTAFLARGMQMDKECQDLELGQDPKVGRTLIDTWSLSEEGSATGSQQTNEPKGQDKPAPKSQQDAPGFTKDLLQEAPQPAVLVTRHEETKPTAF
jgi:hypothetical protein